MCVCVSDCVLIFCCCPVLIEVFHSTSRGHSSASRSSAAMYRPSMKNKELMTLYEGVGEECFDQNEDSISEVR